MKHFTHFKAWFIMLMLLVVGVGSAWAEDTPVYSLTFTKLSNANPSNSYTASHSIACDGINWSVYGNQSMGTYLRVGGRNTTATNRTLSSSTKMNDAIKKITIKHSGIGNGSNSSITINSIKIEGSANASFTDSKSKTINTPSVSTAGTLDFVLDDGVWNANSYYRITVNYQMTGSNNCYLTIDQVDFYAAAALESIEIMTLPKKTTYYLLETDNAYKNLDLTGLWITCKYEDGTTNDLQYISQNPAIITSTPAEKTTPTAGTDKVTIYYKGKSVDFPITVVNGKRPTHTAHFSVYGQVDYATAETTVYDNINFPTEDPTLDGKVFIGWSKSPITTPKDDKPETIATDNQQMGNEDVTFYAVFATKRGDAKTVSSSNLSAKTTDQELEAGKGITYKVSAANSYSNPLRVYKGNSLTITSKNDNITKIVLTGNDTNNKATNLTQQDSGGSITTDGNSVTWTGSAKQVVFNASAQARVSTIEVTTGNTPITYSNYRTSKPAPLPLGAKLEEKRYYATFSSQYDVEFDEDVTVYTVDIENGELALNEVSSNQVPANTGVLIESSKESASYDFIASATALENNLLKPASENMTGSYKFYKLAYGDWKTKTGLGFYWGADNGAAFSCKAGTAYLAVPTSAGASEIRGFSFDDLENGNETAIPEIDPTGEVPLIIYTMTGIRIPKVVEDGLYIVNGKTKWMIAE